MLEELDGLAEKHFLSLVGILLTVGLSIVTVLTLAANLPQTIGEGFMLFIGAAMLLVVGCLLGIIVVAFLAIFLLSRIPRKR